jgi:hypothetical protein
VGGCLYCCGSRPSGSRPNGSRPIRLCEVARSRILRHRTVDLFAGDDEALHTHVCEKANVAAIPALSVFASRADPATRSARKPPNIGRGGGIRTRDPLRPRQVRYQAALRPDMLTHVTQLWPFLSMRYASTSARRRNKKLRNTNPARTICEYSQRSRSRLQSAALLSDRDWPAAKKPFPTSPSVTL